ncbi:MAG TPA: hypothetical protein PL110_03505 [Candidatus Eremiobacteraeota bacterium]|nr:MAG: hypothetical protein BWY64_01528 [bacterium ADurb.Bin363]HPZ07154.1 hypothetical protein [Candidatus Eremiobacteraeota bacterium]
MENKIEHTTIDFNNISLPRIYNIPFRKLFTIIMLIPMLAVAIASQIVILTRESSVLWFYVIIIGFETYLLIKMISLLRKYMVKIKISEDGISQKEVDSWTGKEKTFLWENIKRFKFKPVKSGRGRSLNVYVLEDKKGDQIVFNNLFHKSEELVELIKMKVKLRDWS